MSSDIKEMKMSKYKGETKEWFILHPKTDYYEIKQYNKNGKLVKMNAVKLAESEKKACNRKLCHTAQGGCDE